MKRIINKINHNKHRNLLLTTITMSCLTIIVLIMTSVTVLADRPIMFSEPEPQFEILDEAADKADNGTIAYKTADVYRIIEQSFNALTESSVQDTRIMKMLDITNMMTKELGTDFIENNLILFTENNGWKVELTALDTKDEAKSKFLVVLSPTKDYVGLRIFEFGVKGTSIVSWKAY